MKSLEETMFVAYADQDHPGQGEAIYKAAMRIDPSAKAYPGLVQASRKVREAVRVLGDAIGWRNPSPTSMSVLAGMLAGPMFGSEDGGGSDTAGGEESQPEST